MGGYAQYPNQMGPNTQQGMHPYANNPYSGMPYGGSWMNVTQYHSSNRLKTHLLQLIFHFWLP